MRRLMLVRTRTRRKAKTSREFRSERIPEPTGPQTNLAHLLESFEAHEANETGYRKGADGDEEESRGVGFQLSGELYDGNLVNLHFGREGRRNTFIPKRAATSPPIAKDIVPIDTLRSNASKELRAESKMSSQISIACVSLGSRID